MTEAKQLSQSEAVAQFKRAYHGSRNFMTPDVLGYFPLRNGCAELSRGRGFEGETIYGVTVVRNGKRSPDESNVFHGRGKAQSHINGLDD